MTRCDDFFFFSHLRRTAERGRGAVGLDVLLAKAEVGEDDVTLRVQQDVLGLQVPVDDVERVQVAQRARDLGGVETRPWLQEAALTLEVVEELKRRRKKAREDRIRNYLFIYL